MNAHAPTSSPRTIPLAAELLRELAFVLHATRLVRRDIIPASRGLTVPTRPLQTR